jgi:RNA polymerase sigma-70 factor (ECF subfamily)
MEHIYRQWIDQYQDQTWSLALYLLKNASEAEDAAQEAFIKLWNHRETIDGERVRPWLMKVTRNICLDRLRRRRPEVELDDTIVSEEVDPLESIAQLELGAWLQAAIARLREPYRSLVVLRDIQRHSYEEVAGVTQLSLPQVKTYLHRARKQLREQLSEFAL